MVSEAFADLSIVKELTGHLTAGQDATWTLDVTNLGPSTSRGPITVDGHPARGVDVRLRQRNGLDL